MPADHEVYPQTAHDGNIEVTSSQGHNLGCRSATTMLKGRTHSPH